MTDTNDSATMNANENAAALSAEELAVFTDMRKGFTHISDGMWNRLFSLGLVRFPITDFIGLHNLTDLGAQVLAALPQAANGERAATVITAEIFWEQDFAGKIKRGECVVEDTHAAKWVITSQRLTVRDIVAQRNKEGNFKGDFICWNERDDWGYDHRYLRDTDEFTVTWLTQPPAVDDGPAAGEGDTVSVSQSELHKLETMFMQERQQTGILEDQLAQAQAAVANRDATIASLQALCRRAAGMLGSGYQPLVDELLQAADAQPGAKP